MMTNFFADCNHPLIRLVYLFDDNLSVIQIFKYGEQVILFVSKKIKRLYNKYQKRCHLLHFLKESLIDLQIQFNQLDKSANKLPLSSDKDFRNKTIFANQNPKLHFLYGDPSLLINNILTSDNKIQEEQVS
jgi:hypothetical protein